MLKRRNQVFCMLPVNAKHRLEVIGALCCYLPITAVFKLHLNLLAHALLAHRNPGSCPDILKTSAVNRFVHRKCCLRPIDQIIIFSV